MLSARFKPYHVPLFLLKYGYLRARRRPVLVHFEVTERCNARCGFCDYWKTDATAKAGSAPVPGAAPTSCGSTGPHSPAAVARGESSSVMWSPQRNGPLFRGPGRGRLCESWQTKPGLASGRFQPRVRPVA